MLADWLLFTAATMTNTSVRDKLMQGVYARAGYNGTASAFMDYYNVHNGSTLPTDGAAGYVHRPAACLLAHNVRRAQTKLGRNVFAPGLDVSPRSPLEHIHRVYPTSSPVSLPKNNITLSPGTSVSSGGSEGGGSDAGAIAGGVVGGLAAFALLAGGAFYLHRRRLNRPDTPPTKPFEADAEGAHPGVSPYPRPGDAALVSQLSHAPQRAEPTKAQLAGLAPPPGSPAGPAGSSAPESPAGARPTSSGDGDGDGGTVVSGEESVSPTEDVAGLRAEVQGLRQAMAQIQAERFEPLPEYSE